MLHRAAVVAAVILCVSASRLAAQGTGLRIEVDSATVHLSPSTGSPVIGHARRGAVLEITRDLGSWLKVSWPEAKGGEGYVHVSTGSRAGGLTPAARDAGTAQAHHSTLSQVSPAPGEAVQDAGGSRSSLPAHPVYVAPPVHLVGLGGRIGDASVGTGASVRAWPLDRIGVQLEVSRSSLAGAVAPDRLTVLQFAPSLLYSLPDRVGDYVWVRPYLGVGPRFLRQTMRLGVPPGDNAVSQNRLGFQAFGGAELTFASLPSFALSAGLHYGWVRNPTAGFELGGAGVSVSGHWYVK